MKKILLFAVIAAYLFASCSDSKTFTKSDGSQFVAQPYGWGDFEKHKIEGVQYNANVPDIVLSCLFSGTILTPVLITAFDIMEPVSYEEPNTSDGAKFNK